MATSRRRELVKITIAPADVPKWFQDVAVEVNKTLDRMQQQIDAIDARVQTLEEE
jgi:hypothetical protein